MTLVLVVAAVLIDADGRVLLAQRPKGKSMAGFWEFPGGKLQAGETPESALIRELNEELGIHTWDSCLAPISFASHAYTGEDGGESGDFHLLMPVFACRKWEGYSARTRRAEPCVGLAKGFKNLPDVARRRTPNRGFARLVVGFKPTPPALFE